MAFFNLTERKSADAYSVMFSSMTDEELVDRVIHLGREANFERYLLPPDREALQGIKAGLLSRLRNKHKPS